MKLELPTWAYAAVASAGLLAVATHLATRPQNAAAQPEKHSALQQIVERSFPDANPASPELAAAAQRLYDEKKYVAAVPVNRHSTGTCTDAQGRPMTDCARQCPEEPGLFGRINIGKEQFYFSTLGQRVVSLSDVGDTKKNYDIYWWGAIKENLTRDGPYKYDHERKAWQKVQPWWPARKTP